MTFGSLFSGIGGIDLGLERAGMECRWQVEWADYPSRVLAKHWPNVKRYGNITKVDGAELDPVDLVAGGFPCEDISLASASSVGIIGARSGLWSEFARILREIRPRFAFIENVPALRNRGLALVLQNLRALGYDAEWHCVPACALGAHHERDRIFIVAYPEGMFRQAIIWGEPYRDVQDVCEDADPDSARWERQPGIGPYTWQEQPTVERSNIRSGKNADPNGQHGNMGGYRTGEICRERSETAHLPGGEDDADTYGEPLVRAAIARGERSAWTVEPGVVRMVHGVSNRVDRIAGLGRVVVPQVAEWIGRRIIEANKLV